MKPPPNNLHVTISKELIKPSSQTPPHLRKLQLSYLDQLSPPLYVPFVFFYSHNRAEHDSSSTTTTVVPTQISRKLKLSLSNTLATFYPFAGTTCNNNDDSYIDCNDAGVEFIEARVHDTRLVDVLITQDHTSDHLKHYFAAEAVEAGSGLPLVVVKLTSFECGGIAVGISSNHKVGDCYTVMSFVNAWSMAARRVDDQEEFTTSSTTSDHEFGCFNLVSYFPARETISGSEFWKTLSSKEKLVLKRVIFDKENVEALKRSCTVVVKDPTRVEVVSAFIWKCFIEMTKLKKAKNTSNISCSDQGEGEGELKKLLCTHAFHAVNLRGRAKPQLNLENVLGNCIMGAVASAEYDQDKEVHIHDLVRALRDGFNVFNDDYITKSQSGDDYMNDSTSFVYQIVKGGVYPFTSWCRFPVYEVDFGFGTPACFFTSSPPLKNSTILFDGRSGDGGVEVVVTMLRDDVESLETQMIMLLSSTTGTTTLCF